MSSENLVESVNKRGRPLPDKWAAFADLPPKEKGYTRLELRNFLLKKTGDAKGTSEASFRQVTRTLLKPMYWVGRTAYFNSNAVIRLGQEIAQGKRQRKNKLRPAEAS